MDVDRDTLRTAFLACYLAALGPRPQSRADHMRQAEDYGRRFGVTPDLVREVTAMSELELRELMSTTT